MLVLSSPMFSHIGELRIEYLSARFRCVLYCSIMLLDLPRDLLLNVVREVGFADSLNVRLVSKSMCAIVDEVFPLTPEQRVVQIAWAVCAWIDASHTPEERVRRARVVSDRCAPPPETQPRAFNALVRKKRWDVGAPRTHPWHPVDVPLRVNPSIHIDVPFRLYTRARVDRPFRVNVYRRAGQRSRITFELTDASPDTPFPRVTWEWDDTVSHVTLAFNNIITCTRTTHSPDKPWILVVYPWPRVYPEACDVVARSKDTALSFFDAPLRLGWHTNSNTNLPFVATSSLARHITRADV